MAIHNQAHDVPRLPTRPVRPMRWTYSSMSLGKSKLTTCFTFGISKPRAATCKHTPKAKHQVRCTFSPNTESESIPHVNNSNFCLNKLFTDFCKNLNVWRTFSQRKESPNFSFKQAWVDQTSTYCRGNQDRCLSATERAQSVLTLTLRPVTVNGSGRVAFTVEVVLQRVSALLRLNEHKSQSVGAWKGEQTASQKMCKQIEFGAQKIWWTASKLCTQVKQQRKLQNQSWPLLLPDAFKRSNKNERLSTSSTQTTFCVMFSLVEPTRPTAKKM